MYGARRSVRRRSVRRGGGSCGTHSKPKGTGGARRSVRRSKKRSKRKKSKKRSNRVRRKRGGDSSTKRPSNFLTDL
jgi:hypothetical protein